VTISSSQNAIPRESLSLSTPYEAPKGVLESLIAEVFAEALKLERVGANDDFFDLGGDSLIAEVISMNISKRTGHAFQLSALVEYNSPRKISALLANISSEAGVKPEVTQETVRPPIFIVHGRQGFTLLKPGFRKALADDQKLFMFELPGIRGGRCYERIEDIAGVYVGQLMDEHPHGPIFLAAFCMGSVIALEMAAQLAKVGRPVHQLALIDPSLPNSKSWLRVSLDPSNPISQALVGHMPRFLFPILKAWLRYVPRFLHELRFRHVLARRRREGREKYPELRLSIDATAKLRAAYLRHQPRTFHGPAAVLLSSLTRATVSPNTEIWGDLLPKLRVHVFEGKHQELSESATAAGLLQSIFDDALIEGSILGRSDASRTAIAAVC
jgi:thioesterase domain-containing protein/acyl carrier protein